MLCALKHVNKICFILSNLLQGVWKITEFQTYQQKSGNVNLSYISQTISSSFFSFFYIPVVLNYISHDAPLSLYISTSHRHSLILI